MKYKPINLKMVSRLYLPLAVDDFLEIGTEQTVPRSTQPSILRGIKNEYQLSGRVIVH